MAIYFCKGDDHCYCCLFEDYQINRASIYAAEIFSLQNKETNLKFNIDNFEIGEAKDMCATQFDSAYMKSFCKKFNIKIIQYEGILFVLDRKLIKGCRSIA